MIKFAVFPSGRSAAKTTLPVLLLLLSLGAQPMVSLAAIKGQDSLYIKGADIYFGRSGYKKYEWCLAVKLEDGQYVVKDKLPIDRVPLSRKSIRAFRGTQLLDFMNSVFDCNKPSQLIFRQIQPRDYRALLYYFEKKYKLRLKGSVI